jgi:uncharacterized membrane protein YqjE
MDGPADQTARSPGDETTDAPSPEALASETQPKAPGIFGELANTFAAIRRVISDFLELAALEAKRAGLTLMWMVAGGAIAAILAVTAWLSLVGAVAIWAVSSGISWTAVFIAIALVNLAAAALILWLCVSMSRDLLFSATRRQIATAPAQSGRQ